MLPKQCFSFCFEMGTICFLIQLPSFQVDILIKMLDGMENTPSYSGISVKEMQQKIIIKVISGGGNVTTRNCPLLVKIVCHWEQRHSKVIGTSENTEHGKCFWSELKLNEGTVPTGSWQCDRNTSSSSVQKNLGILMNEKPNTSQQCVLAAQKVKLKGSTENILTP